MNDFTIYRNYGVLGAEKRNIYTYGAPKVPEIGKLLAELYKENKVSRYRHYCEICEDGYPKWFYIYFLTGNEI